MRTAANRLVAAAATVFLASAALTVPAYAEIPSPEPTAPTATPDVPPAPRPSATATATATRTVTAKYVCGAATFHNKGTEPALIIYGPADSEGKDRITLAAGQSRTVQSTEKQFGWSAWANGDQSRPTVGYRGLPGEDLSCDEPDDSKPAPRPTKPKPNGGGGLANTGV